MQSYITQNAEKPHQKQSLHNDMLSDMLSELVKIRNNSTYNSILTSFQVKHLGERNYLN